MSEKLRIEVGRLRERCLKLELSLRDAAISDLVWFAPAAGRRRGLLYCGECEASDGMPHLETCRYAILGDVVGTLRAAAEEAGDE